MARWNKGIVDKIMEMLGTNATATDARRMIAELQRRGVDVRKPIPDAVWDKSMADIFDKPKGNVWV